jgi:ribose-phosphate pyrophosphokinase
MCLPPHRHMFFSLRRSWHRHPIADAHGPKAGCCRSDAIRPEVRVSHEFTVFSGTANPAFAAAIASTLGIQPGACVVDRHPDGDVAVQLLDSIRRKEVFLVQPTSPPVNDHLVELLALADACRRAGAARISSIVPFFGYGRADKRHGRREPIMARVVADLLEVVGISQVVTVDLHTPQIEGFFHVPVDSLTAVPTLCRALRDRVPRDLVVVSPDVGRVAMATTMRSDASTLRSSCFTSDA